jgi:putative membrane protein
LKIGLVLGAIAGLAVGIYLVLDYGLGEVSNALLAAGWWGLAAVTIAHLAAIALCGLAWCVLLVGDPPPHAFLTFFWARFLRDGVNNLIGIVPCAGEVAGARELTWRGIPAGVAGATTVIDVTTELLSQLLFTLLGLAVLVAEQPGADSTWWASGGLAVATIVIMGFVLAQRNGLFQFLESLPARLGLLQLWDNEAALLHAAIQEIYSQHGRIVASIATHLVAWFARCVEALIALYLMGSSLPIVDVIALEALVYALRTVAFVVPSAVGVQEGGYVVIGALFGLNPEVALALSLLKRAREVVLGFPALIAWQLLETHRLWRKIGTRARVRLYRPLPNGTRVLNISQKRWRRR